MRIALATAALVTLAATGCGGGNNSTTAGGGTATASSAAGYCQAHQLRVKAGPGNGATGHVVAPYAVRNVSGPPCTLRGFPHVILLDPHGMPMTVAVKPRSTDFFGHVPVRTVAVLTRGQANFHLAFEDAINGGNCPTAQSMRVTLPSGGGTLSAPLSHQLACPGGVTVSPFSQGRPPGPRVQLGQ
jgi:Protein of unknown function (DUF4232)